ncbi:terminase large subunit [Tenacibaculum phage pT24]|uniref:Terminase large subunit n=1 Tax=Tenacibaculum phage pT24 TaxID=1880590 RepID=A0A1B4XWS1_9CAUD|nr:terminase large subunit [Tenacibaculum phage pT24]BAV39261.1 terminase large subunit [Tenacibaculum phage pT24]
MQRVQAHKKVSKKKSKPQQPAKFDPTIIQKGADSPIDMVWTTETVDIATDNIKNGRKTHSPFFDWNINRKKADVVFKPTKEEVEEYFICMNNLHHFAEEQCKLKNGSGVGHIKLRDYQDAQLRAFLEEPSRRHIMLWSRQAAKTTSSCIYILWEMTFQNNKLTAILGNKLDTSKEVLTKIKEIYELLPFYMKAGIVGWNEKVISFDNKCVIIARPCTKDALNGLSVYILYIDEFAFCFDGDRQKQEEFLSQAQPTLAAVDNSILIITSTPNGKDLFFELYNKAEKGLTTFKPSKVYWWQIPKRDKEWAKRMISEIGLEKFKVQFELSFDATMDKLLNPSTMRKLDKISRDFVDWRHRFQHDFLNDYVCDGINALRISPFIAKKIEHKENKNYYINIADLAEGLGGDSDYTTNHTMRITHKMIDGKPYIYFVQDMVFESNTTSLDDFSEFMCDLHTKILNQEQTRYLFEANKYGDYHRLTILNIGDENFDRELYPETFFKFRRSADSNRMTVGLLTNRAIKPLSVKAFKKSMEKGLFRIYDSKTIRQITNFQKDEKGNFCAEVGHDDLVTPLLHLAWLVSVNPPSLRELIEDYLASNGFNFNEINYLVDLKDDSKYAQKMIEN